MAADYGSIIASLQQLYYQHYVHGYPVFQGQYIGEFLFEETTRNTRKRIDCSGDTDFCNRELAIAAKICKLSCPIWKGVQDHIIYMDNSCSVSQSLLGAPVETPVEVPVKVPVKFFISKVQIEQMPVEMPVKSFISKVQIVEMPNPIEWDITCSLFLNPVPGSGVVSHLWI